MLRRTPRHVQTPPRLPGYSTRHCVCLSVCLSACLRVCVCVYVRSVEATAAQVVGNDDVSDGVKHKLNVGGVGGARLVTVDLFRRALVLRLELRLDVRGRLLVRLRTCHTHARCTCAVRSQQQILSCHDFSFRLHMYSDNDYAKWCVANYCQHTMARKVTSG